MNTANDYFYLSIAEGDRLISEIKDEEITSASKKLHHSIQNILAENSFKASDFTQIKIINGPGSYTGLRVGLAAAKGLAYALNIPILPISYLDFISFNVHFQFPDIKNYLTCYLPMKGEIIYKKYINHQFTDNHILTNTENISSEKEAIFISQNNADKWTGDKVKNLNVLTLDYGIMHQFPDHHITLNTSNIEELQPFYMKSTYVKK